MKFVILAWLKIQVQNSILLGKSSGLSSSLLIGQYEWYFISVAILDQLDLLDIKEFLNCRAHRRSCSSSNVFGSIFVHYCSNPDNISDMSSTHLWPFSKSKFNQSDRVNLVAPASPIECLLYLPNVRAIQYKLGPKRLTRLGNSNVLRYPCRIYHWMNFQDSSYYSHQVLSLTQLTFYKFFFHDIKQAVLNWEICAQSP